MAVLGDKKRPAHPPGSRPWICTRWSATGDERMRLASKASCVSVACSWGPCARARCRIWTAWSWPAVPSGTGSGNRGGAHHASRGLLVRALAALAQESSLTSWRHAPVAKPMSMSKPMHQSKKVLRPDLVRQGRACSANQHLHAARAIPAGSAHNDEQGRASRRRSSRIPVQREGAS